MNGIGMIAQQLNLPVRDVPRQMAGQTGKTSIFQGLLLNQTAEADHSFAAQTQEGEEDGNDLNFEGLLALLQAFTGELFPGQSVKWDEFTPSMETASVDEKLGLMLDALAGKAATENLQTDLELSTAQPDTAVLSETAIQQQLATILKQAKTVIGQIQTDLDLPKAARSILKLLEQWTGLTKGLPNNQSALEIIVPETTENGKKELSVWRDLVTFFQKRDQFVSNQQYNINAKVTSHDVAKVLHKALNEQSVEKGSTQQIQALSSMPMSKVEQYVIYLNQSQHSQSAPQQLIEQLQKVMKTSKFLTMNNGTSQLSITLKPDNLGEMMVKLTRINGEMTVKIMVTSQATKDMLESNMHQLKHMFSPQQVVVEKQDITSQQAQGFQGKQEERSMNEQSEEHSQHHTKDGDSGQQTDETELVFHDLLMNEKV
ncbi:flagellar hook-length control protein FliK [Virgibacillus dakarensis]|uniref:flagellar hook-length control protein FliK n=1 Tax=Virgibacillus dakarensis TaxID=1917889 RepID=UPI000B4442AC|nr:flagellar hook-length control protein FliK [Virgibacillus dakarensis]